MTRENLCKQLDEHIADEREGADQYFHLLSQIVKEVPELRNPVFSETFTYLLPQSEHTHAIYLASIRKMLKCKR